MKSLFIGQATQEATTISGGTPFSKCLELEIFL